MEKTEERGWRGREAFAGKVDESVHINRTIWPVWTIQDRLPPWRCDMGFPSLVSSHIVGSQALGEGPGPPLMLQPRCQASFSLGPGVELPGGSSLAAAVRRGLTCLGEGRWSALTW